VCLLLSLVDMVQQGLELSHNPHIVVATPGRLADHIDSETQMDLKKIKFLVRRLRALVILSIRERR